MERLRAAHRRDLRPDRRRPDGAEGQLRPLLAQPGRRRLSQNANPNIASKSATYSWNDQATCAGCIPGDKRWQSGEEGAVATSSALGGTIQVDPDITAPYSHEASVWLERQLTDTMGAARRVRLQDGRRPDPTNYQPLRGLDAYTVPFNFVDRGVDGLARHRRRQEPDLSRHSRPSQRGATSRSTQYVTNLAQFGRYKTVEVSLEPAATATSGRVSSATRLHAG